MGVVLSRWRLAPGGHVVRIVDEALARLIATDVVGRLSAAVDPLEIVPGTYLAACCWGRRGRSPSVCFVADLRALGPAAAIEAVVEHVRRTRKIRADLVIEVAVWRVVASDDAVPG